MSTTITSTTSSFTQIKAMIWIRFLQTYRDKKFFVTGLLIPFLVIAISIILNHVLTFSAEPDSVILMPSSVQNQTSLVLIPTISSQSNATMILNEMEKLFDVSYVEYDNVTALNDAILNNTLPNQINLGIQFPSTENSSLLNINPIIYYNQSSNLPQLTKSIMISLYKILTGKELNLIEYQFIISSIGEFDIFPRIAPLIIQYGYIFILPYFSIILVIDRDKGIKNHLFLNSLRNNVYWISQFLADYLIYLIPSLIGWAALSIAKVDGIYNSPLSFLLFFTFGFSSIPFSFILQFLFSKEETANKWLYPVVSIVTSVPTVLSSFISKNDIPFNAQAPLSILPSYSLYSGLYLLIQQRDQAKYIILIQIASGLFYMGLIYLIERTISKPSVNTIEDIESRSRAVHGDEDVIREKHKIVNGVVNKDNNYILIDGVYKQFIQDIPVAMGEDKKKSIKHAVDGIWLGIEKNECFGLLGCNGAGKTTLLNIMTGNLRADHGDGYIRGHSITNEPNLAFSSVSSCPQFDILFDNLTVREHLKFFSWIKNVPASQQEESIEFFINKFNIQEHADKKAKILSGGTKRKLSVACALIGGSTVVFLDECSSNLDPLSRRQLWSIINELKSDKAIILTTHSIEEADFLCNRVGIMVNGRLRCLGTPLHLKHKYGSGYQLDIVPLDYSIHRPFIEQFVREMFPFAKPVERIGTTLSYEVPTEQVILSKVFSQIESRKLEIGIKDFSISQSSLEKVFLKLANEQEKEQEKDLFTMAYQRKSILDFFTRSFK